MIPIKSVSLRVDAYEKLRRARTRPDESLSDVVMRARWDHQAVTEGNLFAQARERGFLHDADRPELINVMKSKEKVPEEVVEALIMAVGRLGT
jgi:predicted CopG family antitoxin